MIRGCGPTRSSGRRWCCTGCSQSMKTSRGNVLIRRPLERMARRLTSPRACARAHRDRGPRYRPLAFDGAGAAVAPCVCVGRHGGHFRNVFPGDAREPVLFVSRACAERSRPPRHRHRPIRCRARSGLCRNDTRDAVERPGARIVGRIGDWRMLPLLALRRVLFEDAFLKKNLNGYTLYSSRVRYRDSSGVVLAANESRNRVGLSSLSHQVVVRAPPRVTRSSSVDGSGVHGYDSAHSSERIASQTSVDDHCAARPIAIRPSMLLSDPSAG